MGKIIDIVAPADQQEGTFAILKSWLKAVGDRVENDEPVAELETDKVALEIPAPAGGILTEILIEEEAEVTPGQILARLETGALETGAPETGATVETSDEPSSASKTESQAAMLEAQKPVPGNGEARLSPAVRKFCRENDLDASLIVGSGRGGRVTREDVIKFQDSGGAQSHPASSIPGRSVPFTSMRRRIADHMAKSVATVPHVTALFEADLSAIIEDRKKQKPAFAKKDVKLTYTAYFVAASVAALQEVPEVNSRYYPDHLEIFDDLNIGVGTALGEDGLIVPVIHGAQNLDLFGLASALQDLTERARDGKLKPEDVRDGTFSISNHGVTGSLLATPIIINQPQSAILGIGKVEKRVVVMEEDDGDKFIARPMAYITLTIDHRVLDGFHTNRFLTKFVETIENWH